MLILTRAEVPDVRALVTVAEITATMRGLAAEVQIDHEEIGLEESSVINCDAHHTVARTTLTRRVGVVDEETMACGCWSVSYALGC